ncbi:MAG TPA: HD domain-containing phosphohydrolase [Candidatus Baltobacteraceae bacterium]
MRKFDFLVRFGLMTLVLSLSTAMVLSYLFASGQEAEQTRAAVYSALARVSSDLTPAFEHTDMSHPIPRGLEATLTQESENLAGLAGIPGDRALFLYRSDGTAVFPAGTPPERALVSKAIAAREYVVGPKQSINGESLFRAYSPYGNPNDNSVAVVIGVDFSQAQFDADYKKAQPFVFKVTWIACGFIFISLFALAFQAQRELNRQRRLADETFKQTMMGIAAIIDKRDPYTAGHSERVSGYAVKLAQRMRLSARFGETIEIAALLHDVGKIGIPDAVLLKPARLDEHERAIMGSHPRIASDVLSGVEAMREAMPCILHHHERWDGRGYPSELAGDDIPLGARIIAVADTYDAMTTDRPYRRALTPHDARVELLRGSGIQWDSSCVKAFIGLIDGGLVPPPPRAANVEELADIFGQQA